MTFLLTVPVSGCEWNTIFLPVDMRFGVASNLAIKYDTATFYKFLYHRLPHKEWSCRCSGFHGLSNGSHFCKGHAFGLNNSPITNKSIRLQCKCSIQAFVFVCQDFVTYFFSREISARLSISSDTEIEKEKFFSSRLLRIVLQVV